MDFFDDGVETAAVKAVEKRLVNTRKRAGGLVWKTSDRKSKRSDERNILYIPPPQRVLSEILCDVV